MSITLVFSTLHSHHHIQWEHPSDFADTGNCFTNDTTVCPISGYYFNADLAPSVDASHELEFEQFVLEGHDLIITQNVETLILGRAPPLAV